MIQKRPVIFSFLAVIGIIFFIYSIKIGSQILIAVAILFSAVSAYNITCSFKK